jgi:hypothetical protein
MDHQTSYVQILGPWAVNHDGNAQEIDTYGRMLLFIDLHSIISMELVRPTQPMPSPAIGLLVKTTKAAKTYVR